MRHVTSPNQPRPAPRSVIAGLTAGIFLADLAAPADIAVWWFYTVPVYLVALETKKLNPLNFAGLCSALTVADHYLSAPGGSEQSAVLNRSRGSGPPPPGGCGAAVQPGDVRSGAGQHDGCGIHLRFGR
jgi:hypothetical protein